MIALSQPEPTRGGWRDRIAALNVIVGPARHPDSLAVVSGRLEALPERTVVIVTLEAAPGTDGVAWIVALHRRSPRRGLRWLVDLVLAPVSRSDARPEEDPVALGDVVDASRQLSTAGLADVRWLIPLHPGLVFRFERLFSRAYEVGADPLLMPPALLYPPLTSPGRALDADERLFAWDFVTYRLLKEDRARISDARAAHYRRLAAALAAEGPPPADRGATRPALQLETGVPDPATSARVVDRPAFSLESGSPSSSRALGRSVSQMAQEALEVGRVLAHGALGASHWAMAARVTRLGRATRTTSSDTLRRVVLIGAYGGEHIGDTAILGGVLTRLSTRYGITQATLMSQRAAHTRHLVRMLDVPVEVQVAPYAHARIRAALRQADAIVFAGGPLMDLPKQLVLHLYAVSLARRAGKPLIIEGIGAGVFLRRPSAWIGRRLVKMATRITLRTADDARQPLVRGLECHVGRDPAFDYLDTRGARLTRLPPRDAETVERLLEGTADRLLVGVNLRPIRHDYTVGVSASERHRHTRVVESRFEERFAEALRRFDRTSTRRPCFIFYPMNAIQFGLSDLRSAHRIGRRLADAVDFRVWEADASLDGVVALLRRLDIAIAMRFHAAIFALAQGMTVIGIDYRVGQRDKVAALLDDVGQGEHCARIDEMSVEWLVERLTRLSSGWHDRRP